MAERQLSARPPAQPSYILRGHTAQIHSVRFVRQNSRLLTGDADGWVVYWKLETKRPLAVWKAHHGAVLGTEEWGRDKIITHGRDNSLRIWQLRASDEATFSTLLPAEDTTTSRPKPWLLHTLPVNTLNFCAFSMCYEHLSQAAEPHNISHSMQQSTLPERESILIATPATDDKKINVYRLPQETLRYVVPRASTTDTGMVMAVKLIHQPASDAVLVLSGYEGGLTAIHRLPRGSSSSVTPAQLIYLSQPHSQPILSLDASPDFRTYYTSAADAVIAVHRIPESISAAALANAASSLQTDDSTAAMSTPDTASEVAGQPQEVTTTTTTTTTETPSQDSVVSSAHNPASLSFTKQRIQPYQPTTPKPAGLSSLLSSAPPQTKTKPPPPPLTVTLQPPHTSLNTKHAGQQSLCVRSDGRLFVTGGWDSRIRIYSTKTMKEVAVLKWHKEGVYAVDFAQVLYAGDLWQEEGSTVGEVARKETGLGKLQRQREEVMQCKHWVVAGAKDGKVSLWEVF